MERARKYNFHLPAVLDPSLKRNTAFIKRLRTAVTPVTLSTFLQDIRTLTLHKYLSEIVSACYEGLCKLKSLAEVEAGVEVVSALHQRFGPVEFTENLAWLLGKGMATPEKGFFKTFTPEVREKEERERVARQRSLLRVITELWLVGVLRTLGDASKPDDSGQGAISATADPIARNCPIQGDVAGPFPLEVLKDLLRHDREHANLSLVVIFVKAFSWDILGIQAVGFDSRRTLQEDCSANALSTSPKFGSRFLPLPENPFTPAEVAGRFRSVIRRYFEDLSIRLIRDHQSIQAQARRNSEAYVKSGEIFEDRQSSFERQVKAQDRMIASAQILADAVEADMPDLKRSDDVLEPAGTAIGLVRTKNLSRPSSEGPEIWADDDERRFYRNLVDLKGKVPSMLFEGPRRKRIDEDDQGGKRRDAMLTELGESFKFPETTDEHSVMIANKTTGAQVDALLARLPELCNTELVDQTAVDFCFLNSKASRNRLIKALTEVPRGRSDLLPSWSRLVATLGRHMPDIPKGLVDHLDAEFRSLQRRKEKGFLGQVRLSNIRYLAELTKFGVVPDHVVFHCLKVSIEDFSRMNIEILCNLIENCGRYLLKSPGTAARMANFLETLQRKKSVQHVGQPERMLIDNAICYVDPPEKLPTNQKDRTPMELFIRRLLYANMTRQNYGAVLKQVRRFHWEEAEVVAILEKVFSKPGKVKFGNIKILGILLSALHLHHADFVVRVIDNVIESVYFDLEQNDFRFAQRRIAEVKYLGELYNYRMLEHPVIFDVMYKIMTSGYGGPPVPGQWNPLDPPDDYFRIRLIVTILQTCSMYFNRGAAGRKLDCFLSFFQYYIHTKVSLPMEIDFIAQDVFTTSRPQWKLAANLAEAAKALQLAVVQDQKMAGGDKATEVDEATSEPSSGDENGVISNNEMCRGLDFENESISDDDTEARIDVDNESARESDFDQRTFIVDRREETIDHQNEAVFEREYAKMMAESIEARKFERKPLFDVPLPMRTKNRDEAPPSVGDEVTPQGSTIAFSLLTKRGNRQQTRTVDLPSDSTFAVALKSQQQAEKEEQQRIKSLVLNYGLQQSEHQDESPAAAVPGR